MKTGKLSGILIRAFWLGLLLLAVWANVFILWSVRLYASHVQWFHLSYHEFELMHYGGMILMKICLLVFFLLPYLAIKWFRYSKKKNG
jgi:hypothetical protein